MYTSKSILQTKYSARAANFTAFEYYFKRLARKACPTIILTLGIVILVDYEIQACWVHQMSE